MPDELFAPIHNKETPPTYYYFDGKVWKPSVSGSTSDIISPVDGSVVGRLQSVTHGEIDEVIAGARKNQHIWENTPLYERVKVMHLAADYIRHCEEYYTALLSTEIGKTPGDAKSEIIRTADIIDYCAKEVIGLRGETLESDNFPGFEKGRTAFVERIAHGVVVCIAPFNYPVNLAASKIAPALLMGNAVIFKPPTQGGISGVHLTQLFLKAGIPEGVLSCVTGTGKDTGDYLVSDPGIQMVAFTGSSDTGAAIAKKVPMIPLLFECGGNNPALILPDADMEAASREIIKGAFSYSGQRCTAIKYVLGTSQSIDTLLPILVENMKEMVKMGDPRSPETKLVGPVISEDAAAGVQRAIDDAVKAGGVLISGGKTNGCYVEPTIMKGVSPDMDIVAREIFGPVLSLITVNSIEEAVAIIQASAFGLQACIFTRDEGTGLVLAKQLNVGTVQINGSPQRGPDHFPFMGVKKSGLGVQGAKYSLEAMGRLRSIVVNKPS